MKRSLLIVCTLFLSLGLFAVSSFALDSYDPLPMLPYGVKGNIGSNSPVYGDAQYFFYQYHGTLYEVPATTWNIRVDNDIVYYDFVFTGWLPINGSYNNLTIALGLPKYCVGDTAVDTQFSPDGLTASFSHDLSMFALQDQDAVLNPDYYFCAINRAGQGRNILNPILPSGDFWYSLFYFTISGVDSSSDTLMLTLRIGQIADDPDAIYEGDVVAYGTPSLSDMLDGVVTFLGTFSYIFSNSVVFRIMLTISPVLVFGLFTKLML